MKFPMHIAGTVVSAALSLSSCQIEAATIMPTDPSLSQDVAGFSGDASILRDALTDLYPSLDRYGQSDAVRVALDALDRTAKQTTDPMEFYRAVVTVAVATRDEHVIPFPPEDYREFRRKGRMMLPYTVRWVDGDPYVAAIADPDDRHLVGKKIVEFDGVEASSVRDRLLRTIPVDGLSQTFAYRRLQDFTPTQNENYFDLNYPIWFEARQHYAISVKAEDGRIARYNLEALDWSGFSEFYRTRLPREHPIAFDWLTDTVAYLRIVSFHDWYFAEHDLDPEAELQRIFEDLSDRPDVTLIIDLRQNEGGGDISSLLLDFLLSKPFVEYDQVLTSFVGQPDVARFCSNASDVALDPNWSAPSRMDGLYELRPEFHGLVTGASERLPRDNAFKGGLVVMISGTTGSASVKVAGVLDRETDVLFVGEETGGAAAGATAFGYCELTLPHSGIKVDIPIVRFEREQDDPYGRGILPDIEVDAGLTPPIVQKDEALSAALQVAVKPSP